MEELMELLAALKPEIDFETEKELIDEGLLESFDVITLIAEIEDQFGIEIPAEEIVPKWHRRSDAGADGVGNRRRGRCVRSGFYVLFLCRNGSL